MPPRLRAGFGFQEPDSSVTSSYTIFRPRVWVRDSCGRYWDRTSDLPSVNGRIGTPLTSDFAIDLQGR